MILFDCEKLRNPFNGFHTYTLHLAEALLSESARREEKLGLYIPRAQSSLFPAGTPMRYWHHLDKYWMWLRRDVRIFHASTQLTRYTPRSWRLPVLSTVHDLNFLHLDFPEKVREGLRRRTEEAIRNATHIAAISQYARNDILARYDVPEEKITVIYNGASPYRGPVLAPETPPGRPFLLYLGRVTDSKNIHVLPAILQDNDYDLIVAGPTDRIDREGPLIRKEAARWGVSDRVHFTGALDDAHKAWYLSHCEAFLFPSLAEGFGLPVLEALHYGKPVFSSGRSSLPEVGGDCVFYFNAEFDPEGMQREFAAGMEAFRNGAVPPEKIAAHLSRFTWENAARRYYDLYESLS